MTITTIGGGGAPGFMVESGPYTGEFETFATAVHGLLSQTAAQKSYNRTGTDGPNPLYEFVREMSGSDAHALGEIVYKAKRFSAKHDVEDVLKIAAWAFLIWKYRHQEPDSRL